MSSQQNRNYYRNFKQRGINIGSQLWMCWRTGAEKREAEITQRLETAERRYHPKVERTKEKMVSSRIHACSAAEAAGYLRLHCSCWSILHEARKLNSHHGACHWCCCCCQSQSQSPGILCYGGCRSTPASTAIEIQLPEHKSTFTHWAAAAVAAKNFSQQKSKNIGVASPFYLLSSLPTSVSH